MAAFFCKRLLHAAIVALGALTLIFVIVRVIPGDPATLILGPDASADQVASVREDFGLDAPLLSQYIDHLGGVLRGDLGDSWRLGGSAVEATLDRFPATVLLSLAALAMTILIGFPLGMASARRPGKLLDLAVSTGSLVGQALPSFWLGIVLILLFARHLDWLPESAVQYIHVGRNIAVPVVTVLGLLMGNFIANAVIVEVVFSWPGIGTLMVDAITNRDYAVVEAAIVTITLSYIVLNLLVDAAYFALDPRLTPENA